MSKSDLFSYMTIFKTLQETMDGLHLNMYHRNKLNIILRDTIQSAFDQFMFHKVALKVKTKLALSHFQNQCFMLNLYNVIFFQ